MVYNPLTGAWAKAHKCGVTNQNPHPTVEQRLVARCDAIIAASGLAEATISAAVFGDGDRLKRLRDGVSHVLGRTVPSYEARLEALEIKHKIQEPAA